MIDINNIAVPSITETKFADLKDALVRKLQERIPGYVPHEADRYMPVIEAAAYRELILRERINSAIRSMLLPSAEGKDLDLVAARYGIERSPGAKPTATIKLKLTTALKNDEVIPAGTLLTDSSRKHSGRIVKSVTIPAGTGADSDGVSGIIELDEYVIESYAQTTLFVNPIPYVKEAIVGKYTGGLPPESDEAFRRRILQSLERFSTAGSKESYIYHAMSASTLVKDVFVENAGAGNVKIWIQIPDAEDKTEVCGIVQAAVSEDKVRPLTDYVEVEDAKEETVTVTAGLELYNELLQHETMEAISNALTEKSWALGEDLNISYLYKILHGDNVSRVNLISPSADKLISDNQYVIIIPELKIKLKEQYNGEEGEGA